MATPPPDSPPSGIERLSPDEPSPSDAGPLPDAPDLLGVITAANHAALPYVIIGGFAVIANQYVRATEDVDLLIKGDHALDPVLLGFLDRIGAHRHEQPITLRVLASADTLRVQSRFGLVDMLREGAPPLDFATVAREAIELTFHEQPTRVASLSSLVAFKRLANRPRDQLDLLELERIHGTLPMQPIPGLDD
ncbi:MAG TPA: hypothetical protein VLJ42_09270 [Solirubrobacteraceae bacterium]|nr:hypothetical protein [Solirubrobacteraceae bacterium]